MKRIFLLLVSAGVAAAMILFFTGSSASRPGPPAHVQDSLFEVAVGLIKKFETLHQPRHWPLVGYGHLILPGEKFSRSRAMAEPAAEALLRRDLLKNCAVFREWGADSLILGVLAYNIGSGNVKRSSLAKALKDGNRDVYDLFISYNRYHGRPHAGIRQRRIEEFRNIFIKDSTTTASSPITNL